MSRPVLIILLQLPSNHVYSEALVLEGAPEDMTVRRGWKSGYSVEEGEHDISAVHSTEISRHSRRNGSYFEWSSYFVPHQSDSDFYSLRAPFDTVVQYTPQH